MVFKTNQSSSKNIKIAFIISYTYVQGFCLPKVLAPGE